MRSKQLLTGWVLSLGVLLLAAQPVAPRVSLERSDLPPPGELSPGIRSALAPSALRVAAEGKPLLELWFCRAIPAVTAPAKALGVAYPGLREGTLVGAVRVPDRWSDYKGTKVIAGVYTLRYAIQPADGNHTGVTEYRDFLILGPSSLDRDPKAAYSHDDLVRLGRKTTATPHPAVMGVFPVTEAVTEPSVAKNDLGQPLLTVKIGTLTLGMVVQGSAGAAGY